MSLAAAELNSCALLLCKHGDFALVNMVHHVVGSCRALLIDAGPLMLLMQGQKKTCRAR